MALPSILLSATSYTEGAELPFNEATIFSPSETVSSSVVYRRHDIFYLHSSALGVTHCKLLCTRLPIKRTLTDKIIVVFIAANETAFRNYFVATARFSCLSCNARSKTLTPLRAKESLLTGCCELKDKFSKPRCRQFCLMCINCFNPECQTITPSVPYPNIVPYPNAITYFQNVLSVNEKRVLSFAAVDWLTTILLPKECP